jgi:hypothetical protein
MTDADTATGSFTLLAILSTYMLPTIIAAVRSRSNTGSIGVLNFFLGWTLIGWVVALSWALAFDSNKSKGGAQ